MNSSILEQVSSFVVDMKPAHLDLEEPVELHFCRTCVKF